ncbi:hypothetical protein GCM10027594_31350 [Hymenobacter agri]
MRAEGFHRRQIRKWQHTRWLGTVLLNINRDPEKSPEPIEPWEVLSLPGDPQPAVVTPEELDAELARIAQLDTDWL